MKSKFNLILTILLFSANCLLITISYSQSGFLDKTFGSDGKVTTVIGNYDDKGNSVAILSDGKIVVAGFSFIGSDYDFALVRYNTDGSLDSTFSTDGKVTTSIGSADDKGYSVAVQSDNKIVVAGFSFIGSDYDFALARYNNDGSLDSTFSFDGKVNTSIGSADDKGYSVAIQGDGKIVVAGFAFIGSYSDFALVRYNIDGSLDSSFSSDGKVTTAIGSRVDEAYSVVIQTDGKILVAGKSNSGFDYDFALVRYNSDGTLDNTLDSDGILTTDIGSRDDGGYSVAIQSDGKIVVTGFSNNGSDNDFALVRYNNDGSLDNSFSSDGKVTTAIGISYEYGYSVAIQSDGKIVVSGMSFIIQDIDLVLVRYNSNGTLDNTFDSDGKVITLFGSNDDVGNSIAIQSDGKIVVAGYWFNAYGTNYDFAIARYNYNVSTEIYTIEEQNLEVNVYPNPFTNTTTITIITQIQKHDYSLTIYDFLGQVVHKQTLKSKLENLNLNLTSGMYFCKINNEKTEIARNVKLIIQ